MFIAGEARLSAELSRKQSNFFSTGYDKRSGGCLFVKGKRTFHFQIPPPKCVDQKTLYEITPCHPCNSAPPLSLRTCGNRTGKGLYRKIQNRPRSQGHGNVAVVPLHDRRRSDDCRLLQNDAVERRRRQSFQDRLGGSDSG